MKKYIRICVNAGIEVLARQKMFWKEPKQATSALMGWAMLAASLVINYSAGIYTQESANSPVRDILLDNLPVIRTGFIFIYGALLLWIFVLVLLAWQPKIIPFTVKSIALLVVIRSLFIIMTHLGPYPERAIVPQNSVIDMFTFGADFFFSGHTAFPFLLALIFWRQNKLRRIFLAAAVFFAASVIFGHLHYSIDVFAAFFITHSVHILTKRLFTEEYKLAFGEN